MLSRDAWIQMALAWLDEFRRADERSTRTTAAEANVMNTRVSAHSQGLPRKAR